MCSWKVAAPLGQRRPREIGDCGIALDGDQLAVFVIDQLSATDRAVRTNAARDLGTVRLRLQVAGALAPGFFAGTIAAGLQLFDDRPTREQIFNIGQPQPFGWKWQTTPLTGSDTIDQGNALPVGNILFETERLGGSTNASSRNSIGTAVRKQVAETTEWECSGLQSAD